MKKILLSATLMIASYASVNAQIFTENFTAPQIWTVVQLDTDTNQWGIGSMASGPLASQGNMAISNSWINDGSPSGADLTPDNLIISPSINTTGLTGTLNLSFKVGSPESTSSGYHAEYISVYASSGLTSAAIAAALMSPIHSAVLAGGEQMYTFSYDISNKLGLDSLRLIFRHHNCTGMNFICLDDISVVNGTASINENVITANVYPNPANSVLNVEISEEVELFEITSTDGKLVSSSTSKNVNVADLKNGLYMYRVRTTSGKIGTGNFVKN